MLMENVTQVNRLPASAVAIRIPAVSTARIEIRREPSGGVLQSFSKDEELFAEGDDTERFYEVRSGSVRTYKLLSDGRRLIDAFHFAGDIFGIEIGAQHRVSRQHTRWCGPATVSDRYRSGFVGVDSAPPGRRRAARCITLTGITAPDQRSGDQRSGTLETIASFHLACTPRYGETAGLAVSVKRPRTTSTKWYQRP